MRITLSPAMLTHARPQRTDYAAGVPLLVALTDAGQYRVIAGLPPDRPSFPGCRLDDPEVVVAVESFAAAPALASRPQKMRLAALLAPYLRAPAIAALLEHRDPAEVWRWGALARASGALRDAVLSETLTMTHARPLLALPLAAQAGWVERAIRGRWSVRQLTAAIRRERSGQPAPAPISADIQALELVLGERLGTTVRIHWPDDPSAPRSLAICWYDVESLKGVLAQLAAGPELSDSAAARRDLLIPLQNMDELAALTQHLTPV